MGVSNLLDFLPPADKTYPWPAQGQWRYADYLRLPDDGRRYEIIEGVLYVANAPAYDHQYAVLKIATRFEQHVVAQNLGVILTAPFEVHLTNVSRPVQPDILFINKARQPEPGAKIFTGAPDLIVEVLSPGSLRLDQHVKFGAYEQAGVGEYWIADPKTRAITVYTLPEGGLEYVLVGQFTVGEMVQSRALFGLTFPVESVFVLPS